VLRLLGHTFEVQPALATPEGTRRPDYVLYNDAEAAVANKRKTLSDESLRGRAFAVADAKYWERPLDVSLKGGSRDAFSNKNPSYQVSFYMQHSGTEWGILTNGRCWRLYHRDTAHKLDRFYEVDLPDLVRSGSAEDSLNFYTFFRRATFEEYPLSVGALLRESTDYARSVGDSLKVQVYEALRHLAQGFLDHPRNRLSAEPGTLREIYDSSLILLYRLLFVLYAESRDLLPVHESTDYRDSYSLHAIKHDVERNLEHGRALLPTSATLWPRLVELFGIISEGSPTLKVATFDGGLFDAERHAFLDHHLRTGDSLVGARIASLQPGGGEKRKKPRAEDAAQLSMLADDAFLRSLSNAVGSIWLIEESPADTLEEVREQERLYARLMEDLTHRYARLANLATATHFGVEIDRPLWKPLTDYATGRAPYAPPQFARWLEESEALAAERRYFQWELEFPRSSSTAKVAPSATTPVSKRWWATRRTSGRKRSGTLLLLADERFLDPKRAQLTLDVGLHVAKCNTW
jgi:hypothetical protein